MAIEGGDTGSFCPGQVWKTPKGKFYRVAGLDVDEEDFRKPLQAVLYAGVAGTGKRLMRDHRNVGAWVLATEAEVLANSEAPAPPDFELERTRVSVYLDRDIQYDWVPATRRRDIPLDASCIVLCGGTAHQPAEARCLAYAIAKGGKFRWFGVTSPFHEPLELYGVVGFMPVAIAAEELFD